MPFVSSKCERKLVPTSINLAHSDVSVTFVIINEKKVSTFKIVFFSVFVIVIVGYVTVVMCPNKALYNGRYEVLPFPLLFLHLHGEKK